MLRPILCACWPEVRSVRVALRTLRRALPAVVHVALLYCALLATAALMAYKMLGHKQFVLVSGRAYFASYWDSLFDLYVLVTTANHPDIMMPAFNENVLYVTFFVAFMVLCYFIYMNVVLAVIYNSYKRHLKAEVLESFLSQQGQLRLAFDLLSHRADVSSVGGPVFVCKPRFRQLLQSLPQRRSPALTSVLFAVLDADGSGRLELPEFLRLSELLSVEVSEVQVQPTCLRHVTRSFPRFTRALAKTVNSRWFQYFFDALTLANAVVIGCSGADSWWDAPLEWTFVGCFLLEIALKLLTLGPQRFFRRAWNTFDFVVIGAAFLIGVAETILDEVRDSRLSLDVLLVLRVLRLVKIVGSVKSFQMIVLTLAKILPSLRTYGGVIFIFYYMFAIVGMELFAGLVQGSSNSSAVEVPSDIMNNSNGLASFPLYCGNPKLVYTDFWRQRYCNNNFNDILHSFIVLFELTVVNQWHVLAYGFSAVSHPTARLFFLFFHLLCVTLLLNVFTAFVLEVFLLEYSAKDGVMETQLEKKIHALGLSESRRRRQSSTVSHEELVMQDSSEDEHGGYYSVSRTSSRRMAGRGATHRSSEIADETHSEDDTVSGQVEKADLTDSGICGEEDAGTESPSAPNKPASEISDSVSVPDDSSNLETSCSLSASNPESNPFEEADGNPFEVAGDDSASKQSCSPDSVQDCAARPCSVARCHYDAGVGRSPSIALLDTSVRFHLSKSVRSVEVLLQKLFRNELQKELRKAERRNKQRKSRPSV